MAEEIIKRITKKANGKKYLPKLNSNFLVSDNLIEFMVNIPRETMIKKMSLLISDASKVKGR